MSKCDSIKLQSESRKIWVIFKRMNLTTSLRKHIYKDHWIF